MVVAAVLAAVLAAVPLSWAASQDDVLVTRSAQGYSRDSAPNASYKSPFLEESQVSRAIVKTRPKGPSDSRVAAAGAGDFWIYDAGVDLLFDSDGDGYYHYLRVQFDVDTYYESAYVYAMLFVSADGTTWEHLTTTNDFLVEGSTDFDEYEVETELVAGYPPGLYDVLIEIYDADLGEYVNEFGPAESSALAVLPLEDTSYDGVEVAVVITEEHGGGGAASWYLLGLLGLALQARSFAAWKRRRYPSQA
jgi:hypothetical protein